MTGPFGTTGGPWEFDGFGGVGVKGTDYGPAYPPRSGSICTLSDGEYIENYNKSDGCAIAQVPAMLALVEAMRVGPFTPVNWVEMARDIARELEMK